MQNRNSSVGATAQKSTKSRLLPRPAPILAILMLAAVFCQAQKLSLIHEMQIVPATTFGSRVSISNDSSTLFQVCDSAKGVVLVKNKDSIIVTDSLAAIKTLIATMEFSMQQQSKQMDKYNAATEILNYINTEGYVLNKDRKAFNKAVADFKKLTKQKGKYSKMQNLDILIRDIKGNALGWVSQK